MKAAQREAALAPDASTDLHITSSQFDEPLCLDLISSCEVVLAIHGCMDIETCDHVIYWGGLNVAVRDVISVSLRMAGFETDAHPKFAGVEGTNICNRGRTRKGVQLEVPASLRRRLLAEPKLLLGFAQAVGVALSELRS